MNVLSLFDGMSCGMIALERAGISVNKYYSSEIDKYAIKVSEDNYPGIVRLGDVQSINYQMLPKIDLLIGGSPCQGFSLAGKQLNFSDPRSALFFEFVHALKELKPKYFMLENVNMKKEIRDAISKLLGREPIEINSALVSAQNRKRLYWTNIPGVNQPVDKNILLIDILEVKVGEEFHSSTPKNHTGSNQLNSNYKSQANTIHNVNSKIPTICAGTHGYALGHIKCGSMRGRYINETKGKTEQRLEIRKDDKTNALTTVKKDNYIAVFGKDKNPTFTDSYMQLDPKNKGHKSLGNRVNLPNSRHKALSGTSGGNKHGVVLMQVSRDNNLQLRKKSKCVRASGRGSYDRHEWDSISDCHYRKLTPRECARLQTIPEGVIDKMLGCGVSKTQIYKMIGNGWTIDVIAHIFKGLQCEITKGKANSVNV